MAASHLSIRSFSVAKSLIPPLSQSLGPVFLRRVPRPLLYTRTFRNSPYLQASLAATPTSNPIVGQPPSGVPPPGPQAGEDAARLSAYLGEADSNDAHEANRDAYGAPHPDIDGTNSAYLGEADSNDGFEVQRDLDGRIEDSVDASQSAFLGEADSDDGFEGRRETHPEEGDHKLSDVSGSGHLGESGEGDGIIEEHDRRRGALR